MMQCEKIQQNTEPDCFVQTPGCRVTAQQTSADGTTKFLLEYADGSCVESVGMAPEYGISICVSSQVGCNMGCKFCASGLLKKQRNLTAEEMLMQVKNVWSVMRKTLAAEHKQALHLVVMGTGEPFDNYDEVLRFCKQVCDPECMEHIPAAFPKHVTISTCGLIPGLQRFAEEKEKYNLTISLHAPDNEIRNSLLPVNQRYPIEEVVQAAGDYCEKTGRRITFAYLLLEGINDSESCAQKLADLLLSRFPEKQNQKYFYVNLIPYNTVDEFGFCGSDKETALRFYDVLMQRGIKATLRKARGEDIAAACGQLRAQRENG